MGLELSPEDGDGAFASGGGSMNELLPGTLELTIGSGKEAIASSADDVSIVICFVDFDGCRCV